MIIFSLTFSILLSVLNYTQTNHLKAENKDFIVYYQKSMKNSNIVMSGKIISKKEDPHIPAKFINIELVGHKTGTVTTKEGEFEFIIPVERGVLKIFFVGFTTLEIPFK